MVYSPCQALLIMKWIAIAIMKMMLTKAKNDRDKQTDTTFIKAYNDLVQNYEHTIMFLKAQQQLCLTYSVITVEGRNCY